MQIQNSDELKFLVNKILELTASAIEKLNNLELKYKNFIATKEYSIDQVEVLNKILKRELLLNFTSYSQLVENIEGYFAQDFFVTALVSNLNKFFVRRGYL
jgi:hypothetical protein